VVQTCRCETPGDLDQRTSKREGATSPRLQGSLTLARAGFVSVIASYLLFRAAVGTSACHPLEATKMLSVCKVNGVMQNSPRNALRREVTVEKLHRVVGDPCQSIPVSENVFAYLNYVTAVFLGGDVVDPRVK
jgi:hypothetical protein